MRRLALPLAFVAVALALFVLGGGDGRGTSAGPLVGRVVRVVDGDTIKVRLDGRIERVRYIGMDTPESVKPGTPVQCFAKKASAENERLVGDREVRLVPDAEERDRYGRLLAYVYPASGGPMVNEVLVRRGYARPLTIPPNVSHAERFAALARQARSAGRGLWSACEGS